MSNFCKVTHDLNAHLDAIDAQSRTEDQEEADQIARENDIQQAFISGPLDEEFFYIDKEVVYTRGEVVGDEGADRLGEIETVINLLSLNVSDEVKLKILSDIRESISVKFVKIGGEV